MRSQLVINHIVNWLKDYSVASKTDGFVIGISGGIDSAVTSTLCALTGKKVIALNLPIRQFKKEFDLSSEHIKWLTANFKNVESATVDLSASLESLEKAFPVDIQDFLTMANTRARLRMTTLYAFAGHHKLLVAGTGNKVEDFGIGFFTKYGDGGVDISPIADFLKTEVYEIAKEIGVNQEIINALPTDGLWEDDRNDESQIGASYPELEWAMQFVNDRELTKREEQILTIYNKLHHQNKHKMVEIPIYKKI